MTVSVLRVSYCDSDVFDLEQLWSEYGPFRSLYRPYWSKCGPRSFNLGPHVDHEHPRATGSPALLAGPIFGPASTLRGLIYILVARSTT